MSGKLSEKQGAVLLDIVKRTVESRILSRDIYEPEVKGKFLDRELGVFVLIRYRGAIKGSAGVIEPYDVLWKNVRDLSLHICSIGGSGLINSWELPRLSYEICVISNVKKIENWKRVRLGVEGVLMEKGLSSGFFMPYRASDNKWNLEEFLGNLCVEELGLGMSDFMCSGDLEMKTFDVQRFGV